VRHVYHLHAARNTPRCVYGLRHHTLCGVRLVAPPSTLCLQSLFSRVSSLVRGGAAAEEGRLRCGTLRGDLLHVAFYIWRFGAAGRGASRLPLPCLRGRRQVRQAWLRTSCTLFSLRAGRPTDIQKAAALVREGRGMRQKAGRAWNEQAWEDCCAWRASHYLL